MRGAPDEHIIGNQDLARRSIAGIPAQQCRLAVGPSSTLDEEKGALRGRPEQFSDAVALRDRADFSAAVRSGQNQPRRAEETLGELCFEPGRKSTLS